MQRALDNLIINAIQNTPAGGTIAVGRRPAGRQLVPEGGRHRPRHRRRLRERLFEPFVTGRADGTGLGLAIVREIARHHRGDVACCETSAARSSRSRCHGDRPDRRRRRGAARGSRRGARRSRPHAAPRRIRPRGSRRARRRCRRRAARSAHAGRHGRDRGAAPHPRAHGRAARRRADGLRQRRQHDRGDAARRLRSPHQADRARGAESTCCAACPSACLRSATRRPTPRTA